MIIKLQSVDPERLCIEQGRTDRYCKKELVVGGLECKEGFKWGRDWENGMRARPEGNDGRKQERQLKLRAS